MEEDLVCPLCGKEMAEEEGLYWCDTCGINNHSLTYIQMEEKQEKY